MRESLLITLTLESGLGSWDGITWGLGLYLEANWCVEISLSGVEESVGVTVKLFVGVTVKPFVVVTVKLSVVVTVKLFVVVTVKPFVVVTVKPKRAAYQASCPIQSPSAPSSIDLDLDLDPSAPSSIDPRHHL